MHDFIFENDMFQRSQLHRFDNEVTAASERHAPISVTHAHEETTILVLCSVINSQGAGTDSGCENTLVKMDLALDTYTYRTTL